MPIVESFITAFEARGWASEPHDALLWIIKNDRESLLPIARWMIGAIDGSRNLVPDLLSHLTELEFATVVEDAVALLNKKGATGTIEEIVQHAALQVPAILRPYLSVLAKNGIQGRAERAWRAAGRTEIARLEAALGAEVGGAEVSDAWDCLLETGDTESISKAFFGAAPEKRHWLRLAALDHDMLIDTQGARPLTLGSCHHLMFSRLGELMEFGYVEGVRQCHPTAQLASDRDLIIDAGGIFPQRCSQCDQPLHALLLLTDLPPGFAVSIRPLFLAMCGHCVWHSPQLFYAHDESGHPHSLNRNGTPHTQEFVSAPLPASTVRVSPTPARWLLQDWGLANSRQNLHRLGGRPTWVQNSDYPVCPRCQTEMPFLMQLDGGGRLPHLPQGAAWSEDGLIYAFWCDACSLSAILHQQS